MTLPYSTGRATTPAAGWQSHDQEVNDSPASHHGRVLRDRHPARPSRTHRRRLPHFTRGRALPVPAGVAAAFGRLLSAPARVDRLASRLLRLGRAAVLLLGRSAVPRVDVAVCRWDRRRVSVVDPRAGLQGVPPVGR